MLITKVSLIKLLIEVVGIKLEESLKQLGIALKVRM